MKQKINIIIALMCIALTSCFVVKNDTIEEQSEKQVINLSPKPTISMSDEIVRSPEGDMIAFLPKDWFFVNILDQTSADIFAVAVNQDYTLSAVFSQLSKSPENLEIVRREGVIGLSRLFFNKKVSKSAGSIKISGNPSKITMGPLEFGNYTYFSSGSLDKCRSAVIISGSGNYYEYSLVPMTFRVKPLPTQEEMDNIFISILSTIQY